MRGTLDQLAEEMAALPGEAALFAIDLAGGESLALNEDKVLEVASAFKVLVMIAAHEAALQGAFDLDRRVTLSPEGWVHGSGLLRELTGGVSLTARDLLRLMIVASDNTATEWLLRHIDPEVVNQQAASMGLRTTRLRLDRRGSAQSTARELVMAMQQIAEDRVASPAACQEMRETLARQLYIDQIPRFLPVNPYAADHGGNPSVRVMNKTGFSYGVRADVALVCVDRTEPIAVAVISNWESDGSEPLSVDEPANLLAATLARMVIDTFRPGTCESGYLRFSEWQKARAL